jgi:hypothetical protein
MIKGYIILALLTCASNAFAILCPTNFNTINDGDSTDHIQQLCGKPDTQTQSNRTSSSSQEWEYYVKLHNLDQAMTKMSVLFKDNKVINIHVDDDSFSHSQICQSVQAGKNIGVIQTFCTKQNAPKNVASTDVCGSTIQVDNSAQQVEFACGKPSLVKDIQTQSSQNPIIEVTEYIYSGPPKVSLIFENGALKDRRFL